MPLETVQPCVEPCPSGPGIEGHGEGVKHGGSYYYYRDGKCIPKDKVAPVRYEGGYAGRVHGEVHYLLLAWNGKDFSVLETHYPFDMKKKLARFIGMKPAEAINLIEEEARQRQAEWDAQPKCKTKGCNQPVLRFEKGQKKHECYTCYLKRIGKYKKPKTRS